MIFVDYYDQRNKDLQDWHVVVVEQPNAQLLSEHVEWLTQREVLPTANVGGVLVRRWSRRLPLSSLLAMLYLLVVLTPEYPKCKRKD